MSYLSEIDAIAFNKDLQDTYLRYLFTTNSISDQEPELQETFLDKLRERRSVFNGPYIHCTPCYKSAPSLKDLVTGKGPVSINKGILSLPSRFFDPDQPLYSHQVEAIRILKRGRNLVVATGTGSGKTECFLIPILDSILEDTSPGLRAIIIYPMNALADDQLRRLRFLLSHMPSITFGRYTGDTPWDIDNTGKEERLQNERITRQEIRNSPPHILLTNFAMLEYLLLRPKDAEVFKNHRLQFIVLDEAHTYSGAQGVEIAMLMRRLQQYLKTKPKRLQFVLTSATLGDADDALSLTSNFARDLTGSEFSSSDVLRGEIIDSFSNKLERFPSQEIIRSVAVGQNNFESWASALGDPSKLSKMLKDAGFAVGNSTSKDSCRILFDLFSVSEILAKIHDHCRRTPSSMETLCDLLGMNPDEMTMAGIRWLITMGAYARRSQDSIPLLPIRLHFFARGLSGATACVNPQCKGKASHPNTKWSEFYLEDRNTCEHCGSKVLPLSTCVHCGLPVMKVFLSDGKWKTSNPPQLPPQARLLTWADDLDEQPEEINEQLSMVLCLSCNHYSENQNDVGCCDSPMKTVLHIIKDRSTDEGNLEVCPRCGGAKGFYQTVLRDFRSTEEAPTVVLAETIIRNLPFNPDNPLTKNLPANGRNLLVFSDSRQRAAFFAPYLEYTAAESAYLGPLEKALKKAEKAEQRPVTFEEVATEYVRGLSELPVAVIRKKDESGEEYFELKSRAQLLAPDRSAIRKEVETILYREFCKSNKHKNTLQGLGLAALTVEFNDEEKERITQNSSCTF